MKQQLVGAWRRLRALGGRVVHRLRGSRTVQGAARRVLATSPHHVVPRDVAAGNVLAGRTDNLPVVLVVMVGADDGILGEVVTEVAEVQRRTAGFRPVFVTDIPVLSAARKYRYPAELLIRESDWDAEVQGGITWHGYATRKLARAFDAYGATASVTVGAEGLSETAVLVLNALRPVDEV